jgi:ribosomal protein S18 acetylase RimI-like enzyme
MIRQAASADLPVIAALIDAAYSHYIPIIGRKPRPMLDDHAARIAAGEHYVGLSEAGIEAVITLTDEEAGALHIFNIAVDPAAQGQGWLRRLLAFAEAEARKRNRSRLTLYTNALMERNRAIYGHLGFTELREEAGNGYRVVFMERPMP